MSVDNHLPLRSPDGDSGLTRIRLWVCVVWSLAGLLRPLAFPIRTRGALERVRSLSL